MQNKSRINRGHPSFSGRNCPNTTPVSKLLPMKFWYFIASSCFLIGKEYKEAAGRLKISTLIPSGNDSVPIGGGEFQRKPFSN
jgi:hypothetical protein